MQVRQQAALSKGSVRNVPELVRQVDAGENEAAFECFCFLQGGRETNFHQFYTVRESVHIEDVQ